MPKTKYLSDKEKRIGQKHMYRQEVFNGISFSLMGETVVYLLALYFGAGNFALGYLSVFLAGIITSRRPRMLRKACTRHNQSWPRNSWLSYRPVHRQRGGQYSCCGVTPSTTCTDVGYSGQFDDEIVGSPSTGQVVAMRTSPIKALR